MINLYFIVGIHGRIIKKESLYGINSIIRLHIAPIMNDDELHFTNYIHFILISSFCRLSFHDEPQVTNFSLFTFILVYIGPLHIDHH